VTTTKQLCEKYSQVRRDIDDALDSLSRNGAVSPREWVILVGYWTDIPAMTNPVPFANCAIEYRSPAEIADRNGAWCKHDRAKMGDYFRHFAECRWRRLAVRYWNGIYHLNDAEGQAILAEIRAEIRTATAKMDRRAAVIGSVETPAEDPLGSFMAYA